MKTPFTKKEERRKTEDIKREIAALEAELQKNKKRTQEINVGPLQEAILKGDESAKQKLYAELAVYGGFSVALPGMLEPLKAELAEAEAAEKEEDIKAKAIALKELNTQTLKKFESVCDTLKQFTAELEKLNDEYAEQYSAITGQQMLNIHEKFLGESWPLLAIVGPSDFSSQTFHRLLSELPGYCERLTKNKVEEFIDMNTSRSNPASYEAWLKANSHFNSLLSENKVAV